MNEYNCTDCNCDIKADEKPDECPHCHGDTGLIQVCPMCGSQIDDDTKVCPECKEVVA